MLLMKQMPGSVLVFHHASLDVRFLQKATIETFRCPLLFSYVDTMVIEKRRLHLQGKLQASDWRSAANVMVYLMALNIMHWQMRKPQQSCF